jgi:putative DNA methylase
MSSGDVMQTKERNKDKRLIEDFLPIQVISAEASREKSVRKGHISTLHLWWARRPLVACRAAVYGALVPASKFVPENGPDNKKQSLGRANAAKFIERLCKYPGNPTVIKEAQRHILEAHAERLTEETGKKVTVEDIEEGRAHRPKVLDMFAGGGAIPLEALRLDCEAYALDLNPVAHIIELCTLAYPQKYGKPDPDARGMTGPKNAKGETTWGGLADEVRYWGEWVLKKVKAEIGDLYPLIPDPDYKGNRPAVQAEMWQASNKESIPPGYLMPVAYLWTRTVRCKNPTCRASVPLLKQTWLCKKKGRFVAVKILAPKNQNKVKFEIIETHRINGLDFDPTAFSKAGNAICPFCGTVADSTYVHEEGRQRRIGKQLMAVAVIEGAKRGRRYISSDYYDFDYSDQVAEILEKIQNETITIPNEKIPPTGNAGAATGISFLYGMESFGEIFTERQLAAIMSFVHAVKIAYANMDAYGLQKDNITCITSYLSLAVSRISNQNNTLSIYNMARETIEGSLGRKRLIYSWDFPETNPLVKASGSFGNSIDWIVAVIENLNEMKPAIIKRGSALQLPFADKYFDAVISDPPYYDNIGYSELSDLFYVWLKRTLFDCFPEHFSSDLTPKKEEAVAAAYRQGGTQELAKIAYQEMMLRAFKEASRVLKPGCPMITIYAHKTTSGWATLIDALREAEFEVVEAWPLDTERQTGVVKKDMSMLSSSISMISRKRNVFSIGSYEESVTKEMETIVRERVDSLWKLGITGADLVIAAVGAGLRAFTRFSRVEFANGEEVPAEKFLAEVEGVVLETLLEKIFGVSGSGVSAVDGPSRFYVLWRYTYKVAEMDAGEAIVFTYGQNVELDGQNGLSSGGCALIEKKKGKYRLRDFAERGNDEKLGMPKNDGKAAPLIDVLHRILWLVENEPRKLNDFLDEARPDRERLRLVAQTLAGTALVGRKDDEPEHTLATTPGEATALQKLVANWRSLIDQQLAIREREII